MSSTLLRVGLWIVLIVIVLYVLQQSFEESPLAEYVTTPMLQKALALGILMDAFAVRTLLVPATVALLGRWNWWPSRHGAPAVTAGPDHGPAVTAGTFNLARLARLTRSAFLDVLQTDFVRTARAKGLPEWVVFFKHGLRPAGIKEVRELLRNGFVDRAFARRIGPGAGRQRDELRKRPRDVRWILQAVLAPEPS